MEKKKLTNPTFSEELRNEEWEAFVVLLDTMFHDDYTKNGKARNKAVATFNSFILKKFVRKTFYNMMDYFFLKHTSLYWMPADFHEIYLNGNVNDKMMVM